MEVGSPPGQARPSGFAHRVIEGWALVGGVVLLGVALMTTWSAFSGWVFSRPLPGDFELTEIFVAVAIFAFLPYCQTTDANVTADLFTAGAGPRTLAAFRLFSALTALIVSFVIAWRTWAGLLDYRRYVETTAILKIPVWWAYVPNFASLVLLVIACVLVLRAEWRALVR